MHLFFILSILGFLLIQWACSLSKQEVKLSVWLDLKGTDPKVLLCSGGKMN